ncbi:phosphoribosyl-ATP pyrophosphohydrolase family protein [Clostridium botulinum CDC_1436]|nr:MazG nucleotide pyrophosphohydrolase domain-containing protein [Clostridium botulinum]AJE10839.1 phosphoribosyl-ATP pyrophosphohydrolase family protein [Clostridium botulinum CDC_1436]
MQLMVLDKKDTWEKQADKLVEETKEVLEAIQEGDKEHVAEEVLDVIQVAIGMLDTLEEERYSLKKMICKHLKKLRKRGWKTKKLIILQVFNWD